MRRDCTNRKSFTGFTSEILRCIWLLPVIGLNLFDYCLPPVPTQTRRPIIVKAAHYTTQRMATSTALLGMQKGKYRQFNACSMPEPKSMPRTKTVPHPCTAQSVRDVPPRWNWRGSCKGRTAADHPRVSFFWPKPCPQGQQRQIRLRLRQEQLDTK